MTESKQSLVHTCPEVSPSHFSVSPFLSSSLVLCLSSLSSSLYPSSHPHSIFLVNSSQRQIVHSACSTCGISFYVGNSCFFKTVLDFYYFPVRRGETGLQVPRIPALQTWSLLGGFPWAERLGASAMPACLAVPFCPAFDCSKE